MNPAESISPTAPEILNRQEFLQKTCVGLCACAAAVACPAADTVEMATVEVVAPVAPETPVAGRMQFAQKWVKQFFDVLDANVDEATRTRLMEANGKACYLASHKAASMPIPLPDMVQRLQSSVGPENCRREGNVVYFNYVKNRNRLRIADGYCLCPLVEKGPEGLSGTYCQCSVGYVREMFESTTRRKAQVELLESLKRGGKACRFKITVAT